MALSKIKLAKLANERVELKEQVAKATARLKEIDEQLLTLPVGTTEAGDHTIVITAFHTLDAAKIAAKFSVDKYPSFYKLAVDTAEVKRHIAAVDLPQYQTVSNRVAVK